MNALPDTLQMSGMEGWTQGRQPPGSKVRLMHECSSLTSTDVRDGRLEPREAAIRVKGEAWVHECSS